MATPTRSTRDALPLVRAIAEEYARLLGGKASQHVRRARELLGESFAAAAAGERSGRVALARVPVGR